MSSGARYQRVTTCFVSCRVSRGGGPSAAVEAAMAYGAHTYIHVRGDGQYRRTMR